MCMFVVKMNGHDFRDNKFKFLENAVECIKDRVGVGNEEIKDNRVVTKEGIVFTIVKRNVL